MRSSRVLLTALTLALFGSGSLSEGTANAADKPAAAKQAPLDWEVWKALPVFHKGRVMPLDTFAREQVAAICGRESPTLALEQALSDEEFAALPANSPARALFPNDKPRKFQPVELLFSWLAEPEAWEEVPFLLAEHQDLREGVLGVPFSHPTSKEHLKFVSPRQVQDSDGFAARLRELGEAQDAARNESREFKLEGVDKKVEELVGAYLAFRGLAFDSNLDPGSRRAFLREYMELAQMFNEVEPHLAGFDDPAEQAGLAEELNTLRQTVQALGELAQQQQLGRADAEAGANLLERTSASLAEDFASFQKKLVDGPAPPNFDAEQLQNAKILMARLAFGLKQIHAGAERLQAAIYETDEALRVSPMLSAAALSKDRDAMDKAPPWIDLQTLVQAPIDGPVLRDYPRQQVQEVRDAWERVVAAYRDGRPNDFADFSKQFDAALAGLADKTEPLRAALPGVDTELLTYTQRPATGYTAHEVRYNKLDPFKWSWIISLLGLFCFALAFGVMRKPMYWAGMAVLGLGLAWAAYGFFLRISVTRWAPVTNMYETVIYVPFFVTVLGIWLALLPALWPGVKRAWALTAAPFTWETRGQANRGQVSLAQALMLVPRGALTIVVGYMLAWAPYAAGGRTIINLLPNVDVGASLPDANDLLTWFVGMCVFLPAVWYLPRAIMTGLLSLVTVSVDGWRRGAEAFAEVYDRRSFAGAAAFVGTLCWMVAWYAPVLDGSFTPLQPVLRDNFWLTIHVLTIVSSYGAGALAWGLGNIALVYYLFGKYREPSVTALVAAEEGHRPASGIEPTAHLRRRPPEACNTLSAYIYKAVQVAVLLLAAGTILGGLWADVSWGRFWGWDPKEVWALISLLVYLAILHGRYAGWFGNFGLAAGAVLGATAIIFSWYGVNFVLGAGLHSYGFGAGGQAEVGTAVVLNWLLLGASALRYRAETGSKGGSDAEVDRHLGTEEAEAEEPVDAAAR
jgi:ABC-type transport system involved in cytochrome c biogenesis permease subunit